MSPSEKAIRNWLPAFSKVASGLVVAIGGTVLLGWIFKFELVQPMPSTARMNPITAWAFILAGASLWLLGEAETIPKMKSQNRRRICGMILAGLVALIGVVKMSDYVFGFGFHIDQFMFPDKLEGLGDSPLNEMAPNTALNFFLCGLALLLLDVETRSGFRFGQVFVLTAGLIALLALIGHGYRVLSFYRFGGAIPMALETAIAFTAFCLGYTAVRPKHGFMIIITSPSTGGAVARRLLPMAIIIPWVLGAVLLAGEKAGYLERAFGVSIFAVSSIVIFTGLIWWNAKLLYLADLERARAARRLAVQHNATRVLAEATNWADAAPRILRALGETLGWQAAMLWRFDQPGGMARCAESWSAPQASLEEFIEISRNTPLAKRPCLPGGGACGSGQAAWIPDVTADQTFVRRAAAIKAGLHGAFCFPIQLGQENFGAIECFSRDVQTVDETLLEMLVGLGNQISQFIERARAQEQLKETTANLERSNIELQQFASVASHDLFEPLRMVISFLQLLAQGYSAKLDKEAQEFIGFAIDGARRMQALINDLLAYSRLDVRGRLLEPMASEKALAAAIANLKVAIEESGATIAHDPLPRVKADDVQLTQVFQNLIANALKFRGATPPRIEVGVSRNDSEWTFFVRDNGIGIDPRDFDRVFVIFQRLHTRKEYAGTGMGLAICKKIIERHGGRIWVESGPGKGSTFFFTLPVIKEN
jgi:signal transduction histidine kinase